MKKENCTPEKWEEIKKTAREGFQEKYRNDPEFRERAKQRQRELRSDPAFIAKEKEYRQQPTVKARRSKSACEYAKRNKDKVNVLSAKSRKKPEAITKQRERQRAKRGFPPGLFATLLELQQGLCAVCQNPIGESAAADHCHDSQEPRGLLCRPCNTMEGWIKKLGIDPRQFGERLAAYLENPPAKIAELV